MQRNAVEQEAIAVAEEWLALVDRNDYVASWDKSSASFKSGVQTPSLFKRSISQREWQSSVAAVQTKLGQAESRSLKSKRYAKDLPGEPAGDYIVIEYETLLETNSEGREVVTLMKDPDGVGESPDTALCWGMLNPLQGSDEHSNYRNGGAN